MTCDDPAPTVIAAASLPEKGGRCMPAQTLTNRHRRRRCAMKIDEQTRQALANYMGPITRCPPGRARGRAVKPQPLPDDVSKKVPMSIVHEAQCLKHDATTQWLHEHKDIVATPMVQPMDEAGRGRRKTERARRRRLRRVRNAIIRKAKQSDLLSGGRER